MAYAFDQLTDLIGQQGGQSGSQNIFAPNTSGSPGVQGANPPAAQNAGASVKTDTSGDLGSGTASTTAGGSPSSSGSYNFAAAARPDMSAYSANAGKTSTPQAFSDIQNQVTQNQQALQQSADQYVSQGKAAQQYGVSGDTLTQAVSGDQTAQGTVKNFLGQTAPQVSAYTAPSVSNSDVGMLSTDAGIKQLMTRGQEPTYTPGMSAFDTTMFRSAPGFQNLIQQIQGSQGALEKQAQDYQTALPQQVTDYGKQQLSSAQNAATTSLQAQQKAIFDAEQKAADDANANLQKNPVALTAENAAVAAQRAAAVKNLQQIDPRAVQYANQVKVDPTQFAKQAAPYTASQFITPEQAHQFNNIVGLLNQGQTQQASLPLGSPVSIDNTGIYNNIVSQAQSALAAKDAQYKAQQAQILKNAGGYATLLNRQLNAPLQDQAALSQQLATQALPDIDKSLQQYYNPNLIDASKYLTASPVNYTAQTVLNPEQAKQLNFLNQQLGLQATPYAARTAPASPYSFDKSGYEQALTQALQGLVPAAGASAPAPAQPTGPELSMANGSTHGNVDPFRGLEQTGHQIGSGIKKAFGWR